MIDLILNGAKYIIDKGYEAYKKSDELDHLRLCVQDRVRRELAFNREILQELCRETSDAVRWTGEPRKRLIDSLTTSAFDAVNDGMVPARLLFEKEFDSQQFFGSWDGKETPNAYMANVAVISSQVQLLERAYHRIKLYKLYSESPEHKTNVEYLRFLVGKMLQSL